jgi:predicted permease
MIDFCLFVTLPFNILHSFLGEWDFSMLASCGIILLLSTGYNAVAVLVSYLLYNRKEEKQQKSLRYGTIVSNGGFLGNPVLEGIYGTSGAFYASIFMFPVRIVMWSIGVSVFLKGQKQNVFKKIITNPCIVVMFIGAAIMSCGVTLPAFATKTISGISNCNMPLSMMLIGMFLAEINPKGLIDKTMVFYTGVRLVGVPLIVYALTAFLPIDPMLRGITVIIAGMPAPITTALLSAKYGGDEKYATGMIFLSTIASLFTLPLWCLLF